MTTDAAAALAVLADPVRAAVYDIVLSQAQPVGRDRVAELAGLPRATAAFQLDRLAASGLLAVSYARPAGRTGPGAGRPAKLYRRAEGEVAASAPERSYDLMGGLLAGAIEASATSGRPVLEALRDTARDAGAATGARAGSFDAVLARAGYHPAREPQGVVMMNCPFHRLAAEHTDVVCTANHAFLCGAAQATDRDPGDVRLEPGAGRCCVRIVES
jgi:predicted ArsR family transcriptional regulator